MGKTIKSKLSKAVSSIRNLGIPRIVFLTGVFLASFGLGYVLWNPEQFKNKDEGFEAFLSAKQCQQVHAEWKYPAAYSSFLDVPNPMFIPAHRTLYACQDNGRMFLLAR